MKLGLLDGKYLNGGCLGHGFSCQISKEEELNYILLDNQIIKYAS